MLEWFSKKFEQICSIIAVINFIAFGVAGAFLGSSFGHGHSSAGKGFLFFIIGVVIAFFVNMMTFGFIAQFIEIRKGVERLSVATRDIEGMLEKTNFDEEITNIKVIVKIIEEKIQ